MFRTPGKLKILFVFGTCKALLKKLERIFLIAFRKRLSPNTFLLEFWFELIWVEISGALLPSHGLPPFGANITNIAMSEGLCGSSMFGGDRWGVGVNPMTAGKWFERVGHH